jgi:hypothetical protein
VLTTETLDGVATPVTVPDPPLDDEPPLQADRHRVKASNTNPDIEK